MWNKKEKKNRTMCKDIKTYKRHEVRGVQSVVGKNEKRKEKQEEDELLKRAKKFLLRAGTALGKSRFSPNKHISFL